MTTRYFFMRLRGQALECTADHARQIQDNAYKTEAFYRFVVKVEETPTLWKMTELDWGDLRDEASTNTALASTHINRYYVPEVEVALDYYFDLLNSITNHTMSQI